MLILRDIYVVSIIFILLSIGLCIFSAIKQKTPLSYVFLHLQVSIVAAIFCCFIFYWIRIEAVANIFWGLYLVFLDVALFFILEFTMNIGSKDKYLRKPKGFQWAYFVFIFIDAVLNLSNFKTKLIFDIHSAIIEDSFTTWIIEFKPVFSFHLIFCYLISTTILIGLIKSIVKASKYRRPLLISLLILFLFSVFLNGLFLIVSDQWIFDYSSIVYGLLLILVYSIAVYSIPKYVKKNLISISSENISDGIVCFDDTGKCVYRNKIARDFYEDTDSQRLWVESYLNNEKDVIMKTEEIETNGQKYNFKVEFRRLRDSKNRNCGSYIKFKDCTSEVLSVEKEFYRATHDELTGLYNRDYFFKEMSRILKEEPEVPRYLIATDIKDFKLVNELFGHEFGDRVLVRQAEMLQIANYKNVIHGRISGDHFAMLIPKEFFNPELAKTNSEKITDLEEEVNFKLFVCIGVYEITDVTENVHTMFDKAVLAVKNLRASNNQHLLFYDTELMNKLMIEKTVVSEFTDALNQGQFEMYLQPQIEVKSGKCLGAEALVRWNYPGKGCLTPVNFIKALEKSDQIHKLDFYIWEEAVKKLSEWNKKGIDLYISVNISVKDFYYANLYDFFTKLVRKYEVSPSKLNLEITESMVINENKVHINVLNQLQTYGFKIEMDDFGSGYSSLNVLKDISMDVLKLDMGFLGKTENMERGIKIIASIEKMAKALNMEVISEGVETQEQADVLCKTGVDIFQGYLYSKPIPVSEFENKYVEVKQ